DCLEIVAKRLIEPLVKRKSPVIKPGRSLIARGATCNADGVVASLLDRFEGARADRGQQRHAVSGALFGINCHDILTEDVGLNLAPQRTLAAAAGNPNFSDWDL